MGKPRVLYWFRTDLRLHDSPALQAALDLDPEVLWPVFTWDPHYVRRARGEGVNRWQFLLDCQADLSASLSRLNPRSRLLVLREAPQTLLPRLFAAWGVTHLAFERDSDPSYPRGRDEEVAGAARAAGVEVVSRAGRTLWDPDEVVARNGGLPPMSIAQLQAAGARVGEIPRPLPAPASLPDPGDTPVDGLLGGDGDGDGGGAGGIAGPEGDFAIETLAELGLGPATTPHRGGETRALQRLAELFDQGKGGEEWAATFRKPQTSPAAFDPPATTLLSPHLHFGALSARELYWRAQDAADRLGSRASKPPESLTGQLLFRDMYFAAHAGVGAPFAQALGNAHCRFIPWHLPSKVEGDGDEADGEDGAGGAGEAEEKRKKGAGSGSKSKSKSTSESGTGSGSSKQPPPLNAASGAYTVDSAEAERWFRRWRSGTTGFPFVDALMRQLRAEGWIHHLGRHMLACFLTRGGCYVHWERGAAVFEELLLDHEPAANSGNWQWLSCAAFYAQYFRCYSPVAFGRKWDPEGRLVRRYVPELARLDARYIYEPWKAPQAALDDAGVRLVEVEEDEEEQEQEQEQEGTKTKTKKEDENKEDGGVSTYPRPMFDFNERRSRCIAAMKTAFRIGLHGDDEAVRDGSWRRLFEEAGETEMEGGGGGQEQAGEDDEDDDGEHADDAEHEHVPRGGKHGRSKSDSARQGPMDRHVKKTKT